MARNPRAERTQCLIRSWHEPTPALSALRVLGAWLWLDRPETLGRRTDPAARAAARVAAPLKLP
ncbi:hypothetical protein AB0O07_32105 [Streptomyces sp. NPDC093085]|uniref:hypothetical protein n=1 Tax=Streptomyces sp. NPDC093085 TaxID=3155068 RepID=UPI0034461734